MIESAVRTRLLGSAALAGLGVTRIEAAPANQPLVPPMITYQRIASTTSRTMEGLAGPHRPRIQIDCWATSYVTAKQMAEAVRQSLEGWRQAAGANEAIRGTFLDGDRDLYEPDTKLHRVSSDFFVWAAAAA